jgi:hypothetical protein
MEDEVNSKDALRPHRRSTELRTQMWKLEKVYLKK